MRVIYAILAISGWAWFLVVMAYLLYRSRRDAAGGPPPRGSEVLTQEHGQQH